MTKILKQDGKTIIQTDSRIDTATAGQFEQDIHDALQKPGAHVEMDCSQLTYMASSGLRVIQQSMRQVMAHGGTFKMTNVGPKVYKVLAITGFTKFIRVEQSQ